MYFGTEYHKKLINEQANSYHEIFVELHEFWKHLSFEEMDYYQNEGVLNLLRTLEKQLQNGGVLFRCLSFTSLYKLPLIELPNFSYQEGGSSILFKLFEHKNVVNLFPEFHLKEELIYNPDFKSIEKKYFIELMDYKLRVGAGAYGKGVENKLLRDALINNFHKALKLEENTTEKYYLSQKAWNPFFTGYYDTTIVIVDCEKSHIHVLALTDAD
jgi:hypothetical protein